MVLGGVPEEEPCYLVGFSVIDSEFTNCFSLPFAPKEETPWSLFSSNHKQLESPLLEVVGMMTEFGGWLRDFHSAVGESLPRGFDIKINTLIDATTAPERLPSHWAN